MQNQEEEWLGSPKLNNIFNFSESKLYRLLKTNEINHLKIEGKYHYLKSFFNPNYALDFVMKRKITKKDEKERKFFPTNEVLLH
ncbi:MAG: hypothetical protein HC854_18070 [Flavobacterium sp.]|nr:hypothetical protein [Flavobacterium sp.]